MLKWFLIAKDKCPIKKYKSSKYITGDPLLIHENFHDRVKPLESLAKECKIHLYIKGSYYQLPNPSQQVLVSDADLVIGHGFRFEIRDEKDTVQCNKICLSKSRKSWLKFHWLKGKSLYLAPGDIPEVNCFLQGAINRGLVWSRTNTDVLSDGTYAANTAGYQTLKTDIQTKCQKEKFKRQLLRALRKMYEDEDEEEEEKK